MVAALRADREQVASYARVLTETLGAALPDGMVEVHRRRSLADRVRGRAGQPVFVRVRGAARTLELREGTHGLHAELRSVVRGVVIARSEVGIERWLAALAEELCSLARRDAAAHAALARLFEG